MDSKTRTNGKISYSYTSSQVHLMPLVVRDCLIEAAEKTPDRVGFIVHKHDKQINFSSLKETSYILGQNFLHLNLKKSDRVAVLLPNCAEFIYSYYACSYIGLIVVPLTVDYGVKDLSYMLDKISPSAVVVDYSGHSKEIIDELLPNINLHKKGEYQSNRFPSLKHIIVADFENVSSSSSYWKFSELSTKYLNGQRYELPVIDTDDGFAILFTSGTTGKPKGVLLTNFGLLNNTYLFADPKEKFDESKRDNHCFTGLMYHFGFVVNLLGNLCLNKQTIIPSSKFDLESTLECIQKYKCKSLGGLPKILNSIIDSPLKKSYDFSSVKSITSVGSYCPKILVEKLFNEPSIHMITIGYGMTEIGGITANLIFKGGEIDTECLGFNVPLIESKVVDPNTGNTVPLDTEGELHVRGFTVTKGYWNDPENTAKAIDRNNWFNTGDVVSMNEEGVLFFKSRSKDIIVVKTSASSRIDVHHSRVEEVLLKNDNVDQTAVFGIRVNEYEQELCAWIVLKSDEINTTVDDIKNFCKEKLLDHEIPNHIKFSRNIPANNHGKYLRGEMERICRVEFGL